MIKITRRDATLTIQMNRPDKKNALQLTKQLLKRPLAQAIQKTIAYETELFKQRLQAAEA